jgi:hypothetical protein
LDQIGQILRLKNRPGNVHDSKGAQAFLRELLDEVHARFGRPDRTNQAIAHPLPTSMPSSKWRS